MFKKEFLGILITILILSIGVVSANENTTCDMLTDTIQIDSFNSDEDNFQKIIDDAKENDMIEINTTIEAYAIINIDKNITLKGTSDSSGFNYASLNIAKGDVTLENLAFKGPMSNFIIEAKNEKLNLVNCTIENYVHFSGKSLRLTDCTIKDSANGILATGDEIKISNCLFKNINIPLSVYDARLTYINSTMKDCRSGMSIENCDAVIRDDKFYSSSQLFENVRLIMERNIFNSSYPTINNPAKYSLKNNTFINSKLFGKNIEEISGCEFIASRINVEKCGSVTDCEFRNISGDETCIRFSSNFKLANCSFINNNCTQMFNTPTNGVVHITDCLFENNTGDYLIYGGYFNTLELKNIEFFNNSYRESLIKGYESENFNLISSEFKNNTAGESLINLKEIKNIKITSNVVSQNICPKIISMSFLDYHIDYHEKITTSFTMTNNIFAANRNIKNKASEIFLSPKIASDAINNKWGTKLNLNNNYFGYNILNVEELNYYSPISFKLRITPWKTLVKLVNVELVEKDNQHTLRFVDLDGKQIKMPEYDFTIKTEKSEINVNTKDGKGLFEYNDTLSNAQILNDAGENIKKPKATITFEKIGARYYNFALNVYMKIESKPIAKEEIVYTIYIYSKSGKLMDVDSYESKTSSDGKFTIKLFQTPNGYEVGHYAVKVAFANENCAFTQEILKNIKIYKTKTIVKAPKVTKKYKKSQYFQITVKNKDNQKAVKNVLVKLKIGKKTYNVKTNSKGIAKFNTKNLKVGKHNVVISSGNQRYSISAKSTIIIKK